MIKSASVLVCALGLAAVSAEAGVVYDFFNVTGNSLANASAGEAQLSVTVDAAGPGKVSFLFENRGSTAMSITDVYFDDGTLLGIASINGSSGVDFSQNASPRNLPGGNLLSPAFETSAGFSADSNSPAQPNGVGPGESLTIVFDLLATKTLTDIITELNSGRDLRIGIHVQGFGDGGSESFVNNVPTPGALALLALGGLVVGRRRR